MVKHGLKARMGLIVCLVGISVLFAGKSATATEQWTGWMAIQGIESWGGGNSEGFVIITNIGHGWCGNTSGHYWMYWSNDNSRAVYSAAMAAYLSNKQIKLWVTDQECLGTLTVFRGASF